MKGPVIHIFCVRELRYSESSAQRRIVACRLLDEIPEIEKQIADGTLSLTNISKVNHFFKGSDSKTKKDVLNKVQGLSSKECEKKLFEITGKKEKAKEKTNRVTKNQVKITLILNDESIEMMKKVKSLLGKEMNSDELIQFMAEAAIKKLEKVKFKQTVKTKTSLPLAKVGRLIPAQVKRDVYERDKKCTNCGSVHNLNYDHRKAYSLGGTSSLENIRLLCFQCNQRGRIRLRL